MNQVRRDWRTKLTIERSLAAERSRYPARALRILFLAQRLPHPPNRGDRIPNFHFAAHLAARHDVLVCGFDDDGTGQASAAAVEGMGARVAWESFKPGPRQIRSGLRSLASGRPLTVCHWRSSRIQAAVDEFVAEGCDVAYVYSSSMCRFLEPHPEVPLCLNLAEMDSDKFRQYGEVRRGPMGWVYRRESRLLLDWERHWVPAAGTVLLISDVELALLEERIPGSGGLLLPNGVDLENFHPADHAAPDPSPLCVFTGVMDYEPNVDAVNWFADEILPLVRRAHVDAGFLIVGTRPIAAVRDLAKRPGIEVTGKVDEVLPHLHRARVAVAPVRLARGLQNKVLEAFAAGVPVVTTPQAFQGVDAISGEHCLVADTAEAFADAVTSLLSNPVLADSLAMAGRARVEEAYRWEAIEQRLEEILLETAGQ